MNIFILSKSCKKSAKYYFNSHVSKIILEIAQLMSTAILSLLPTIKNKNLATLITNTAYRSTHVNHPFAIWMRTSNGNWNWGFKMATALHNEWKYRYDHHVGGFLAGVLLVRLFPPQTRHYRYSY